MLNPEQIANLRALLLGVDNDQILLGVEIAKAHEVHLKDVLNYNVQDYKRFYKWLSAYHFYPKYYAEGSLKNKKADLVTQIGIIHSMRELNLTSFYAFAAEISTLHEGIGMCYNLEKLTMNRAGAMGVPSSLENLEKLKSLTLSQNKFKIFPSVITKLTTLEHLDLSRNPIRKLPKGLANLTRLQTLDLKETLLEKKDWPSIRKILPNCKMSFTTKMYKE